MAKISVLMGIYNTKNKEYLKKSLNSILNQTFKDFELIICNDGSTNDCEKWAKDICKNDKRVKFISNDKNKGLAYTLNHCLKYATGEYIARMDDDDESSLDRFQKQYDFLENNKNYDLVSSNINFFDHSGIYGEQIFSEIIKKKDFLFNSPIVHPVIMCRKSAFILVGGYRDIRRTIRVEDYDMFMRMFDKGVKMYVIQEKLLNYRNDKDTFSRRKKYKYRINEFKVRLENFYKLGLFPLGIIYAIKPLVVDFVPKSVINYIRKKR